MTAKHKNFQYIIDVNGWVWSSKDSLSSIDLADKHFVYIVNIFDKKDSTNSNGSMSGHSIDSIAVVNKNDTTIFQLRDINFKDSTKIMFEHITNLNSLKPVSWDDAKQVDFANNLYYLANTKYLFKISKKIDFNWLKAIDIILIQTDGNKDISRVVKACRFEFKKKYLNKEEEAAETYYYDEYNQ